MKSPVPAERTQSLLSQTKNDEPAQRRRLSGVGRPRARRDGSDSDENVFPESSSPEEGGNFRKSYQIDMKGLVGDAVGNMSISPASRDIVLAARRGLFIIDLQSPLDVPRFLPQGGTWDVADVQWNPHPSRAEYIVSTSCEKLLIWNLAITGKSSIEHILHSHYRAITDINWHNTEPDTVVSVGIDSWLWAWDLREPRKPTLGLCTFTAGGTQVKWSRQNANIIASSHANQVFIWDRRKGSLPISQITAHDSKIYGIDWAHDVSTEIVTCSLDKTIKVWNIDDLGTEAERPQHRSLIHTSYPVWRARNLPFGRGVLSLAQRGVTTLEMYSRMDTEVPVETFEGHTDVVKEFVWRKGGQDEFQLITWSKDRTLRFWPVDTDTMESVGHTPTSPQNRGRARSEKDATFSFRIPPHGTEYKPTFSAPIGHRSILAEVRAGPPAGRGHYPVTPYPPVTSPSQRTPGAKTSPLTSSFHNNQVPIRRPSLKKGGTMSRGNFGGKSVSHVDPLSWLSNVKVDEGRRDSSSGHGSGIDGGSAEAPISRLNSHSRERVTGPIQFGRNRSESRTRGAQYEDKKEGEGNQSLQDEITSVLNKLSASKIKLEKINLKRRTCTLGLHGPWGESSSVFIRITLTFPREYPHGAHLAPDIDLERNTLISMPLRAYMLRRLHVIRSKKGPRLEACLRFLLFRSEDSGVPPGLPDEESSSEDESKDSHRNHKNITEPRTSQGFFGPNGELVCFFRAPPRIVRNVLGGDTQSPPPVGTPPRQAGDEPGPVGAQPYQSPSLLSDAVRRLGSAASTRHYTDRVHFAGDTMSRIMTNLLTFSESNAQRRPSLAMAGRSLSYSLVAPLRSTVFMLHTNHLAGGDKRMAEEYVFEGRTLVDVCIRNADAARLLGRFDHERVFRALAPLFPCEQTKHTWPGCRTLIKKLLDRFYEKFSREKDVQMLAMFSVLVLQACNQTAVAMNTDEIVQQNTAVMTNATKFSGIDYFSLAKSGDGRRTSSPTSPMHSRFPITPQAMALPATPSLSSSTSSRGSWSSLFIPGNVGRFMTGMQDTLANPNESPPLSANGIPLSRGSLLALDSPLSGRRRGSRTSPQYLPVVSKSWNDTVPSLPSSPKPIPVFALSSLGRRPGYSRRNSVQPVAREQRASRQTHVSKPASMLGEKRVIFVADQGLGLTILPLFNDRQREQLMQHVLAYAEVLFAWELLHKRLELLKSIKTQVNASQQENDIAVIRKCAKCTHEVANTLTSCPTCILPALACSICRIPVRGLSHNCLRCRHIAHVSCWRNLSVPVCPSGCGCNCSGTHMSNPTSPTTSLPLMTASTSLRAGLSVSLDHSNDHFFGDILRYAMS